MAAGQTLFVSGHANVRGFALLPKGGPRYTLSVIKTIILTALALLAFAANSLLARAGLIGGAQAQMGAMEFTLIRLFSGALMLALLLALRRRSPVRAQTSWAGAAMLLLYALMFSLAYLSLSTGFGALCLFAAVQLTILGLAAVKRSLSVIEALGAALAFAGFVWLVWPGLLAEEPAQAGRAGIAGMSLAGIGWGLYTVLGRHARDPLALTSGNFWRASLLALPLLIFILPAPAVTLSGAGLAIISGAITSGIGYAIWYAALPKLTPAVSGAAQLLVPPLAALMGWAALGEVLTARLAIATAIIFAGLIIVMLAPNMRRL